MALSEDLLAVADQLARDPSANPASFRRATSTAYYAVFHALIDSSLVLLLSPGAPHSRVRRAFGHGEMSTIARAFGAAPVVATAEKEKRYIDSLQAYGVATRPRLELIDLANRFVRLQTRREIADYDTSVQFTATEAPSDVSEARLGIAELATMVQQRTRACVAFLPPCSFEIDVVHRRIPRRRRRDWPLGRHVARASRATKQSTQRLTPNRLRTARIAPITAAKPKGSPCPKCRP